MRKSTKVKIVVYILFLIIVNVIIGLFTPEISALAAVKQMNSSIDSSVYVRAFDKIVNSIELIEFLIFVLIFFTNIKTVIILAFNYVKERL